MCIPKIVAPRLASLAPSTLLSAPSALLPRKLVVLAPMQRMAMHNNITINKQFATFKTASHVAKEKKCHGYQDDASSCPALTYICIITFFSGIVFLNLQDQYKKSHA